MNILEFGNKGSNTVLIQPVDDHDLAVIPWPDYSLYGQHIRRMCFQVWLRLPHLYGSQNSGSMLKSMKYAPIESTLALEITDVNLRFSTAKLMTKPL